MEHVYSFTKNKVEEDGIELLKRSTKCWAHFVQPSSYELEQVSKVTGIAKHDLEEATDEDERPKVTELDDYSMIVVRAPLTKGKQVLTTSLAIFISKDKNNIITFSQQHLHAIEIVEQQIHEKTLDMSNSNVSYLLFRILDELFNTYFVILDTIEQQIDKIEDKVLKTPDKITTQDIFSAKKTLIYFHKALTSNREVLSTIESEYVQHIDKKNAKRFMTLYHDATQLLDMTSIYREVLTSTIEIHTSSVSNNLNQVVKTLTIISSFVLVPTLISGIYGMNFSKGSPWNMPELYWEYGYFFALGLMLLSTIIAFMYFKKKKWL